MQCLLNLEVKRGRRNHRLGPGLEAEAHHSHVPSVAAGNVAALDSFDGDTEIPGVRRFYVSDNLGNRLEFIAE